MKTFFFPLLPAITGCLLFISAAHAQTNPASLPAENDYGLLGKSYFAFDGGLIKYRNAPGSPTGLDTDLALNLQASDNLDLGFGYDFIHAANSNWKTSDQVGRFYGTGFVKLPNSAPYATAGVAYGWEHGSVAHNPGTRFHRSILDLGTGVEVPLIAQTSVCVGVDYDEALRQPRPKDLSYQLALDLRFDDTFCTDVGADLQSGHNGTRDAVVYHAGLRITFD